jgi:hypothetical protein
MSPWVGGSRKRSICKESMMVHFEGSDTYRLKIIQGMQFGTQSSVNAQKLFVHDSCEGESTERLHARFVNLLGIFVLAFELECKVIGQMPALMVPSEQPKGVGIPDLQGPQVKHTFNTEVSSIDVVSKEEVSGLCRVTADFK